MSKAGLGPRRRATLEALASILLPGGHELPGAEEAGVPAALDARAAGWVPRVRAGVGLLIDIWDLGPLLSSHRRRFSSLDGTRQRAWVERCYRSRSAARRLQVAALKQLIFLVWASQPEVEDALGYDYRCLRDGVPHGVDRPVPPDGSPPVPERPEPADYSRPGPAIASGAVPLRLLDKRSFEARTDADRALETLAWPDVAAGALMRADVVVVGSGAGGATVAAYLAEAGADVIVVEEGPQVDEADMTGPVFDRFQRFCRDNGTTQVWGTPPIPLPLGRVVGGTTVVNSGTCFRAPAKVLERWRTGFGIEAADPETLAADYADIEDFLNVRPVPWNLLGPNGTAAHDGAVALGYSGGPLLRNIADCHGCGQCAFGCPTNAKQAMHITFLPRAQRAGARVLARCKVERIIIERGRATGVIAHLRGPDEQTRGRIRIDAAQVVVCAGAIHTPGLLMGGDVPDPSRQTGRNLRIHPATGVGAFFDGEGVNFKGTLQSYYIDEFYDSDEVMFEATTTLPGIGAAAIPGIGDRAMEAMSSFGRMATLGFYVSDTSKGRVRRLPNGEVMATYRLNELDTQRMCKGLAIAAEVLLAAGATRAIVGLPGLDAISSREDIEQIRSRGLKAHHLRLTAFHPMGTVRMGADPALSVVGPDGAHHSIENLWVADASTFPSCVGVNPQMTIMAFARRTARAIAGT